MDILENNVLLEVVGLKTNLNGYIIHRSISFKVHKGSTFVIMGPSGGGKTTLINFLIKKDCASTGRIYWKGELWDKTDIPKKIGYAPQSKGFLTDLNVGYNIAFPLIYGGRFSENDAYELAMITLVRVGLDETVFYKDISCLSGGMLKRVLIARAIILSQELLILDEPMSGLDCVASMNLQSLILDLRNDGKTIICISHDYMDADYYGFLKNGQLIVKSKNDPKFSDFINACLKNR